MRKGFGDGFVAGLKGILELAKSIPQMIGAAAKAVNEIQAAPMGAAQWSMEVLGDEIASWWYHIEPQVLRDGVNKGRRAVNEIRRMGLTAVEAARLLGGVSDLFSDLLKMKIVDACTGNSSLGGFPGLSPNPGGLKGELQKTINRVIDNASPLTILLLDAISDLGPYEQGYAAGMIFELVAEWAVITGATEGAGALAESAVFQARLLKLMESLQGLAKNSERLQALVKALRETKFAGRTMEEVAEELKTTLRRVHEDEGGTWYPFGKPSLTEVPTIRNGAFQHWFNQLTPREMEQVWSKPELRAAIERRLRSPGRLHEWLPVSRAVKFKKWGISAEQIQEWRSLITDVKFRPFGVHGGDLSGIAHNEILQLVDDAKDFASFKAALQQWAKRRLVGGSGAATRLASLIGESLGFCFLGCISCVMKNLLTAGIPSAVNIMENPGTTIALLAFFTRFAQMASACQWHLQASSGQSRLFHVSWRYIGLPRLDGSQPMPILL